MMPSMPKVLGKYWGLGARPDDARQQKKKEKKRAGRGGEGRDTAKEDETPAHDELRDRRLEANPDRILLWLGRVASLRRRHLAGGEDPGGE
jgi:hypothetical protein